MFQPSSREVCCGCIPAHGTLYHMLNVDLLTDRIFVIYAAANFLTSLGFYVPYFCLSVNTEIPTHGIGREKNTKIRVIVFYRTKQKCCSCHQKTRATCWQSLGSQIQLDALYWAMWHLNPGWIVCIFTLVAFSSVDSVSWHTEYFSMRVQTDFDLLFR